MKLVYSIIACACMLSVVKLFAQKKADAVKWSVAGTLPPAKGEPVSLGVAGAVSGVHGNKLFVAGGANFPDKMPWQGGKKKYHDQLFIFFKKGNYIHSEPGTFKLPENVAYSASCSTLHGVVYAGGENEKGITNKVFLVRWNETTHSAKIDSLPGLPTAITNASAASINNIVFVAGGETPHGVSGKCWSMDLDNITAGWKQLPDLPQPVSHAVFIAFTNKNGINLYLLGGRRKTTHGVSELYSAVYHLNHEQTRWRELASLPYPLSAGTGVATVAGNILLFGGDRGTTFSKVETCIAAISKSTSESEIERLIEQKNQLLASHPGFDNNILLYNVNTGKCRTIGTIPYPVPVTTTATWWNDSVIIPSGEIRAGVRTPEILMAKPGGSLQ